MSSSAPAARPHRPRAEAAYRTGPPWAVWFVVSLLIAGCSDRVAPRGPEGAPETSAPTAMDDDRTVIVYLTRTGNTEAVARLVQGHVGGRLVPLELVEPYPEDYQETVRQVVEENESGHLPPLTTRVETDDVDVVFLGFPTWDMKLPPPVKSFLDAHDLSGKTVVPFNTNAGYGVGSGFRTVREMAPGSRVLDGLSLVGGIERDGVLFVMEGERAREADEQVRGWLRDLGFLDRR